MRIEIDGMAIKGIVTIALRDVHTGETEIRRVTNNITDAGLNLLLRRLVGATPAPMGYMVVGTGTGTFSGEETAMYDEVARKALLTPSIKGNVGKWPAYFSTSEAVCIVRELGLTNAAGSGAGTLISHVLVSPEIEKTATQEMAVLVQQVITRA